MKICNLHRCYPKACKANILHKQNKSRNINRIMQKALLRYILTLCAALFIASDMLSQDEVSGIVRDSDGNPVAGATILAFRDSLLTPPMSGYAITRGDGSFAISKKGDMHIWLHVKCLGYEDVTIKSVTSNKQENIILAESARPLNEILVKGTYSGVKVVGDTIKFDTDHFRTGTEDNMADVLKKLPGIEVSEGGRVSYSGKTINKLLINGRDILTSSSEGTVVNNMSADMIKGAEILKRYHTGSLTDGYEQSDLMALNIKTGNKRHITGNADAVGGIKDKCQGKAAAIYLGGKTSATMVFSANNTGKPVFSMGDYLTYITGYDNILSGRMRSISLSGPEALMVYTPENTEKQDGSVFSAGASYKPSDSLSVKGNVILNRAGTNEKSTSEDIYFSDNSTHIRSFENGRRTSFISGTTELLWKPTRKTEISGNTKLSLNGFDSDYAITNDATNVNQDYDYKRYNIGQILNINYDTGNGLLFLNTSLVCSRDRQEYALITDNPLFTSEADTTGRTFNTNTKHKFLTATPEAGYVINLSSRYNLNINAAYSYDRRENEYTDGNGTQKEQIDLNEYSAGVFLRKKEGLLRLNAGSRFSIHKYSSTLPGFNGVQRFISPSMEIEVAFSQTNSITVSLSRSTDVISNDELTALHMFNSYNSITATPEITSPYVRTTNTSACYNMYNIKSRSYLMLMLNSQWQDGGPRQNITQNGLLTTTSYDNKGKGNSLTGLLYFKQELRFLPASVTINTTYSHLTDENTVNEIQNKTNSDNITVRLNMTTNHKKGLNYEVETQYKWQLCHVTGAGISTRMTEWRAKGVLSHVTKAIRLKAYAEYRKADSRIAASDLFDIGFSAEYRIKNIGIKLSGENLFHLHDLEWTAIDTYNYFSSTSTYSRVPGNIMLGLTWRF